jgi:hypothetical protein
VRKAISAERVEQQDAADAVREPKLITAPWAFEAAVVQVVARDRSGQIIGSCGRMLYSMHGRGLTSNLRCEPTMSRYGNVR